VQALEEAPEVLSAMLLAVDCRQIMPKLKAMCNELATFVGSFAIAGLDPRSKALPPVTSRVGTFYQALLEL
jgi:hypothetical protein